jgi:cell division protein ZapE
VPYHHDPAIDALPGLAPLDPAQHEAGGLLLGLHRRLLHAPEGRGRRRLPWSKPAEPIDGLYLWGGVGRGKTYLMDWFAESLPLPGKRRLHFHHFMRDIHDAMSRLPKQPDPLDLVADLWRREVRVLCLDELIVTDIADAMILHRLLKALLARGMTLVATSNMRPRDLYPNGLQRALFLPAIALLERHTQVFELDGGVDYRLRTLASGGVYRVTPDGEGGLAEYFDRLAGGHRDPVERFSVNGRSFPVRRLGGDLVWFDFDALCATARSASDYIEIAREYHTVLISGVPRLDPEHEAAARRFVHLVDELYDQRVKLVIGATVPICELYSGGLVQFPHERLLSRLVEMQSTDYLAAARSAPAPPRAI